jgi:hypothetical protein
MDRIRKARALAFAGLSALALCLPHARAATAASAGATPSPAPAASATAAATAEPPPAGSDAAAATRAREWISRFQSGNIDRSQLTPAFNTTLDAATIAAIKGGLPTGDPIGMSLSQKGVSGNVSWYIYIVSWKQGDLSFSFGITSDGKIDTAYFRPV